MLKRRLLADWAQKSIQLAVIFHNLSEECRDHLRRVSYLKYFREFDLVHHFICDASLLLVLLRLFRLGVFDCSRNLSIPYGSGGLLARFVTKGGKIWMRLHRICRVKVDGSWRSISLFGHLRLINFVHYFLDERLALAQRGGFAAHLFRLIPLVGAIYFVSQSLMQVIDRRQNQSLSIVNFVKVDIKM